MPENQEWDLSMDRELWLRSTTLRVCRRPFAPDPRPEPLFGTRRGSAKSLAVVLCLCLLLVSCAVNPRLSLQPEHDNAFSPIDFAGTRAVDGVPSRDLQSSFTESLRRTFTTQREESPSARLSYEILTLSSGGADGVFGAGILAGWTEAGTRPDFDLVTGVSVGALLAPFAFLGPEWDGQLTEIFRQLSSSDLHSSKWFLAPLYSESILDSGPLAEIIEGVVDSALVAAIARRHAEGARLFIGTTALDSGQFVVWDIGSIATRRSESAVKLIRKILRASSAVPMAYSPVEFDVVDARGVRSSELHVDGAVVRPLFIPVQTIDAWQAIIDAGFAWADVSCQVTTICNGPLEPTWQPVRRQALDIAEKAVARMIYRVVEADVLNLYLLTRTWGARFRLTYVPADAGIARLLQFDASETRALFDLGKTGAITGEAWVGKPPSWLSPSEIDWIPSIVEERERATSKPESQP